MRRFKYLKDYNITSYSNSYDNLPAIWIDAIDIMDFNIKQAKEQWQIKN